MKNEPIIIIVLISSVLIAGCTSTGQVTGCQPDWLRQDIAVLNDENGAEYCSSHCIGFNAKGKLIQETVLETRCYCDLGRC